MTCCNKNIARREAILFPCATCNLKCRYCNIDKNPVLKQIDDKLAESFKGDYYFNRIKEYFPLPYQLKQVSTWGGEPFLHMERVYETIHKLINYYPYFSSMYSSTNFSYPNWTDKFFGLMEQFEKYPYRKFSYQLQLSCDGPEYINDAGRGEGVTKKCLANFDKLVKELPTRLPSNVTLHITIKSTLDVSSVKELNSKEKIIEYYRFFEDNFIKKIRDLGYDNVFIYDSIPNTAVPAPITKEEGENFAVFCKYSREIQNEISNHFDYYSNIIPYYRPNDGFDLNDVDTYVVCDNTCGSGSLAVGFLPDNLISVCNEGFTQIFDEYKKIAALSHENSEESTITYDDAFGERGRNLCMTDEEYKIYESHMANYCTLNARATTAVIANLIVTTALAGQIEERYKDIHWAVKAARFIRILAYCVKDNYNVTGSVTLVPIGLIRLLLNGAIQYLWGEE